MKKFNVPVQQLIDGLKHIEFSNVVVIGRQEDGRLYLVSSEGDDNTAALVDQVAEKLESGDFDE
jgi:hypothetical protein